MYDVKDCAVAAPKRDSNSSIDSFMTRYSNSVVAIVSSSSVSVGEASETDELGSGRHQGLVMLSCPVGGLVAVKRRTEMCKRMSRLVVMVSV